MNRNLLGTLVVLLLFLPGCALLGGPGDNHEGIPVAEAAGILRGVADDIELWDVDKNGLIGSNERLPLGIAVTTRILLAFQAADQEEVGSDREP